MHCLCKRDEQHILCNYSSLNCVSVCMSVCRHLSGVEKGLQVSYNLIGGEYYLYQGGLDVLLKFTRGTTLLLQCSGQHKMNLSCAVSYWAL